MNSTPRNSPRVPLAQKVFGVLLVVAVFACYVVVQLEAIRAAKKSAELERAEAAQSAKP